jgi:hypothetical protein
MRRTGLRRLLGLAGLLAACSGGSPAASPAAVDAGGLPQGCTDGDPNDQRYGATCLCCHTDEFGVAGSIDRQGAPTSRIVVVDSTGVVADMQPNGFGNFFRHVPMAPPLQATAYGPTGVAIAMQEPATSADCNACHRAGGSAALVHGP